MLICPTIHHGLIHLQQYQGETRRACVAIHVDFTLALV